MYQVSRHLCETPTLVVTMIVMFSYYTLVPDSAGLNICQN
jgi:hypothetical protein